MSDQRKVPTPEPVPMTYDQALAKITLNAVLPLCSNNFVPFYERIHSTSLCPEITETKGGTDEPAQ